MIGTVFITPTTQFNNWILNGIKQTLELVTLLIFWVLEVEGIVT